MLEINMNKIVQIFCNMFLLYVSAICSVFADQPYELKYALVKERKAVFATIEPRDVTYARARVTGTVDGLMVDEGDTVKRGDVLAVVVDEKQPLEISALDARMNALMAQSELAKTELGRIQNLRDKGVASQSQLDESRAKVKVLDNEIDSLKSQRDLLVEKLSEAQINSPANGRILQILQTNGSVVQTGEKLASIATENYILRLTLPERHAQSLEQGSNAEVIMGDKTLMAKVQKIYPLIERGEVTADLVIDSIGNYFVGQRVLVYIPVHEKNMLLVPNEYIHRRHGLTFVTLDNNMEIAVQLGHEINGSTEVLTGLKKGDKVIRK